MPLYTQDQFDEEIALIEGMRHEWRVALVNGETSGLVAGPELRALDELEQQAILRLRMTKHMFAQKHKDREFKARTEPTLLNKAIMKLRIATAQQKQEFGQAETLRLRDKGMV